MNTFKITETVDTEQNPFDRQERIGWWDQERLRNAKIMVVGAGAIGNEVLKNLALLGVGNIFIIDFDWIAPSNLSRTVLFRKTDVGRKKAEVAAESVKEMALLDTVNVEWFHGDLVWEIGTGIYREMDIVLGCLDNIETRMAVNKHCRLAGIPWIDAGMKELGLRVEFYHPRELPCYECNLTDQQFASAGIRYSCDQFKREAFDHNKMPTTQITSSIVAGLQVQETIKYLCGYTVKYGSKIYFQGSRNDFDIFSKTINPECTAHVSYAKITCLDFGTDITLRHFLTLVSQSKFSGEGAALDLRGDRTFVKSIQCRTCGCSIKIMRPSFRIKVTDTICEDCKSENKSYSQTDPNTETVKEVQAQFDKKNATELMNMTLSDIGIPLDPIVPVVDTGGNYKYYELTADKQKLLKTIFKPKNK